MTITLKVAEDRVCGAGNYGDGYCEGPGLTFSPLVAGGPIGPALVPHVGLFPAVGLHPKLGKGFIALHTQTKTLTPLPSP